MPTPKTFLTSLRLRSEAQNFDAAMRKILSVSKIELQRRLDAEKSVKLTSSRARAYRG